MSKKNTNTKKKAAVAVKKSGRQYRIGRKLPLSLLLAFTLPLTICLFGPFETYCGNIEEFLFSLGDFLPLCAGVGLAVGAALLAVLLLLDGIAYDIACARTFNCIYRNQ